ncbi:MAG: RNA polymerase sigma factor [Gemmatimonadota bacterium]|nr:RNA polymerase sigma factor [Gemmatimonadota bacterium]
MNEGGTRTEEGALVERMLAGEPHLYGTLVERYQRRLWWSVFRMVRDADEADDVVQEAFVRAWDHLDDFDTSRRFYTWIYRIARNRALNVLRRRKVRRFLSLSDEESAPPIAGPGDTAAAVEDRELAAALRECRERLPEAQRETFDLRHDDGMRYAEIATATGVPEGTVMSRLYRARERMRECLEAKGIRWRE